MTVPNEEFNSINSARRFLYDLLNPKITPRVPKYIRKEAHRITKHFPLEVILRERYSAVLSQTENKRLEKNIVDIQNELYKGEG